MDTKNKLRRPFLFATLIVLFFGWASFPSLTVPILPLHGASGGEEHLYTTLLSAAQAASFYPPLTNRRTLAFLAGNNATAEVAYNLLASVRRLRTPFPVLIVPLDAACLALWTRLAAAQPRGLPPALRIHVLAEPSILQSGAVDRKTTFHEVAYNKLCQHKWRLAADVLELGFDAFLLDPDLVFLRDPFAFLYTFAPNNCSFTAAFDTMRPVDYETTVADGGFKEFVKTIVGDAPFYWNTGQCIMSSADLNMKRALQEFLRLWDEGDTVETMADQDVFVARYINSNLLVPTLTPCLSFPTTPRMHKYLNTYWEVLPDASRLDAPRGLTIAEAMLAPRCIVLGRRALPLQVTGAPPPAPLALSTWPLSNWFFYSRYSFTGFDNAWNTGQRLISVPHATLMMPCVVHYNWVGTLAAKVPLMRENGHWFGDLPPPGGVPFISE